MLLKATSSLQCCPLALIQLLVLRGWMSGGMGIMPSCLLAAALKMGVDPAGEACGKMDPTSRSRLKGRASSVSFLAESAKRAFETYP